MGISIVVNGKRKWTSVSSYSPARNTNLPFWALTNNVGMVRKESRPIVDGVTLSEYPISAFTGGTTHCTTLAQVQAALDAAVDLSLILIDNDLTGTAGSGVSLLTHKYTGSGRVCIAPTNYASLGSTSVRIDSTTHAATFPKITRTGGLGATGPILGFANGSRGLQLTGMNWENGCTSEVSDAMLYISAPTIATYSNQIKNVIWDRGFMNNPWTAGGTKYQKRGINANCKGLVVLNSIIRGFCSNSTSDSQAIVGMIDGEGDVFVWNSELEGSSENIMWGGGNPVCAGMPGFGQRIIVLQCYLPKRLAWMTDATVKGQVKNFIENKLGDEHVYQGNVSENHNGIGQQHNFIAKCAAQNALARSMWRTRHILVWFNKFTNGWASHNIAFSSDGTDDGNNDVEYIQFAHNLDITPQAPASQGNLIGSPPTGGPGVPPGIMKHIWRINNTLGNKHSGVYFAGNTRDTIHDYHDNNNLNYNDIQYFGVNADDESPNSVGLNKYCGAGNWETKNNGIVNGTNPWDATLSGGIHNNKYKSSVSLQSDYTIDPTDSWKGSGSDGRDIGADIPLLTTATAGVVAGTPT